MTIATQSAVTNKFITQLDDTAQRSATPVSLRQAVHQSLKNYFHHLGQETPIDLYSLVLQEVERPLLVRVMEFTKDNQSRAAILLGLSRGTLRKKLKEYGLL